MSRAHWVKPEVRAAEGGEPPSNHGCSRIQATVSAPSSTSWTIGSNRPPEPNVPRHRQHDHVIAREQA